LGQLVQLLALKIVKGGKDGKKGGREEGRKEEREGGREGRKNLYRITDKCWLASRKIRLENHHFFIKGG
jgi:hypothetical protein